MLKPAFNSSGQALLIILLVMAVVLTIGLSVVARSITDVTISRKGEEAARAFSAAEAGIEQILIAAGNIPSGTVTGGSFTASKVDLSATNGKEFVVPSPVNAGEVAPVWFVGHDATTSQLTCSGGNCFTGSTIKVCWGEQGTPGNGGTTPAIEVSVLYTTGGGEARMARGAYDPKADRGNGFSTSVDLGCTVAGRTFAFAKEITLSTLGVSSRSNASNLNPGPQAVRLRLLYNTDKAHTVGLAIVGDGTLPTQGTRFVSVGSANDSDAKRKIEVYQLFSDLPPIFDFAVFSGTGGITK